MAVVSLARATAHECATAFCRIAPACHSSAIAVTGHPGTVPTPRRIAVANLFRATAHGRALTLRRVTALCRHSADHVLRLPAAPPATPGVAVVSFAVQLRTDVQVRSAVFRAWLASTCHLDKHPNPHRRSGWCATTLPDTEPLHICWVPTTNHLQSDGRGVRHSGNPSTFTSACNARGASPGAGSALPGSCGDVPGRQRREQHPRHRDRKFLLASSPFYLAARDKLQAFPSVVHPPPDAPRTFTR